MYEKDWHSNEPYFEDCLSEMLIWAFTIGVIVWGLTIIF